MRANRLCSIPVGLRKIVRLQSYDSPHCVLIIALHNFWQIKRPQSFFINLVHSIWLLLKFSCFKNLSEQVYAGYSLPLRRIKWHLWESSALYHRWLVEIIFNITVEEQMAKNYYIQLGLLRRAQLKY